MKVNMPDVETGGELIDEGRYDLLVKKSSIGVSPKGNECIKWQMEVTSEKGRGKVVFQDFYEKAMWKLKQLLLDMKAPEALLKFTGEGAEYAKALAGLKFSGYIEHRKPKDSDRKFPDLKNAKPLKEGGDKGMFE